MSRARDEAEWQHPDAIGSDLMYPIQAVRVYRRSSFMAGTSWLAEELLSDEAVEAAAKEIHAKGGVTEELRPATCNTCAQSLTIARAALTAALEAVK